MKAAVFHSAEDLRIEGLPEPSPGPGQVKIRNAYVGICGSDLAMFFNPSSTGLDFSKPHPVTGSTLPQVLGHEFSGTIVETGEGVDSFSVGDDVTVFPMIHCGSCDACVRGLHHICRNMGTHGFTSDGGGLATYTVLPADKVYRLPEGVDLRTGALTEPLAVAWHAVRRSEIASGGAALILGGGPIGIALSLALRAHGVSQIFISEPNQARREVVEKMGIARGIDPTSTSLAGAVGGATGATKVDVVFDAAGNSGALDEALELLIARGLAMIVAIYKAPLSITGTTVSLNELRVLGSLAYEPVDFENVIAALGKGLIDTEGWTESGSFDELEHVIRNLSKGHGMKVLIPVP